jgi:RNA polymerase sigma-70 factor (ECF subfamily)
MPTDTALMGAIRQGNPEALAALYDRRAPIVLAVCQRVLDNRSDAEDVLEEVFFEIWQRAERYDPERGSPISYILTVGRSRAIDRARRLRRRLDGPPTRMEEVNSCRHASLAGEEATPFRDAVAAERSRRVRDALNSLDPAERRVVELSFFEGWTHREIARQLSEPLGTVKSRIRRGLLRLRSLLRAPEEGEEAT